jgi:formylglycine-generating enzyme
MKVLKYGLIGALAALSLACNSLDNKYIPAPDGMVYVPENDNVSAFFMDISPVTVGEFDKFVKATAYQTEAHRFGNAGVFNFQKGTWELIEGANYWFPLGKGKPQAQANHPVTQVSWRDALAYATWAKKRLPTYQEWVWAAKNADKNWQKQYAWGDELIENQQVYKANVWQGAFPHYFKDEDGFQYTSPVGHFGKTPLGLTDVGGNVWQWCQDWANPQADTTSAQAEKLQYGGSFLCDKSVCHGYQIGNTAHATPETSLCHVGFRRVKAVETP